ncbi:MAG: lipoyl synthase [Candidatus Margulisbacteria bacterium]|nr:lipoyl synthase [Candidatus Margulisiibacteriota bacterium]
MALPNFLVKRIPKQENIRRLRQLISDCDISTVCESAKCPNIGECFSRDTLTFMILGKICTRSCRFCGVEKGSPLAPDPEEPKRISRAVDKLGLAYVVVTSVTRDDLPDGGAEHFKNVGTALVAVRNNSRTGTSPVPPLKIEFLIPDFQGNEDALRSVLDAKPYVLNHNVETVPRLYKFVRPQAVYQRSLALLKLAKRQKGTVYTKSGFMVGLGEDKQEVFGVLNDLKDAGCDIVTIGQYLPPTKDHPKAARYVHPDEFNEYKLAGAKIGLKVFAGPFVRSSFQAKESLEGLI